MMPAFKQQIFGQRENVLEETKCECRVGNEPFDSVHPPDAKPCATEKPED
jgi:hypothetical protein